MAEYLSPGVYVEEIEIGAKPIEGVSTSTAGFLGETERGSTTPRFITSWTQYQRVYGGYFGEDKYLPYAVEGFFKNGGQRCYIGRIVGANAVSASVKLKDSDNADAITVEALGVGVWGKNIYVKVSSEESEDRFKLNVYYWKDIPNPFYDPDLDHKSLPRPSLVESFDNLSVDETSVDYFGKKVNGISNLIEIKKIGTDSGKIPAPTVYSGTSVEGSDYTITLASSAYAKDGFYNDMFIEMDDGQIRKIENYDGSNQIITVSEQWTDNPATNLYKIYLSTISLISAGSAKNNSSDSTTMKLSDNASDCDDFYKDMFIEIIDGNNIGQIRKIDSYISKTIKVNEEWSTNPVEGDKYKIFILNPLPLLEQLESGSDGNPIIISDYKGEENEGIRTGLLAFEKIDDISILYSPNSQSIVGLSTALITHCENMKDRFAIIDSTDSYVPISTINPRSGSLESKYAAFYYPWIKIIDPQNGMKKDIPPGGYMAGIYARSDVERGVHKAPANETVRGVVDLQFPIGKGEQDILNPRGVNCIRAFPGRGIRVWGARTLSSDPLWKYINVRRLFIYLEESIDEGTQWVVFEPNSEILWDRVIQTISGFLKNVWKSGALMGRTPEEAFFVKCDRTTMTQNDIDNGRLIVMIGVAPVKPAEFVIFRIAQWTGSAEAESSEE